MIDQKYLAEYIGTFGLVFCGTGAIVINEVTGGSIGHTGIAITFGLIVMAMIYAVGDISGAHLNPAVTIGFYLSRRFPGSEVLPYMTGQLAGALTASIFLSLIFAGSTTLGETIPSGAPWVSFALEIILTFILVFVILRSTVGSREKTAMAGIAIGVVVLLEAMFAGPVSGASMNPFRSLAPALISGNMGDVWIYLAAPVLGSIVAAYTYLGISYKNDNKVT